MKVTPIIEEPIKDTVTFTVSRDIAEKLAWILMRNVSGPAGISDTGGRSLHKVALIWNEVRIALDKQFSLSITRSVQLEKLLI